MFVPDIRHTKLGHRQDNGFLHFYSKLRNNGQHIGTLVHRNSTIQPDMFSNLIL